MNLNHERESQQYDSCRSSVRGCYLVVPPKAKMNGDMTMNSWQIRVTREIIPRCAPQLHYHNFEKRRVFQRERENGAGPHYHRRHVQDEDLIKTNHKFRHAESQVAS